MSKIYCMLAPLLVAVSLFVILCKANLYGLTTKTGFDNSVYLFSPTERHFSLAKRDSSGAMLFSNEYGGTGGASYEVGFDMALDEARGIVYIVGSTESHDLYGAHAVQRGNTEGFVLKIDSNTGAVLSSRRYAAASVVLWGCAVDSTGSLWFTGYTYGAYYNHALMVPTSSYMMVHKIGNSGETLFITLVGGDFGAIGDAMAVDSNDNVYAAGFSTASSVDGQTNAYPRLEDILVVKFDSAGVKLWTKLLGGIRDDRPSAIAVDSVNNRVYISGSTNSPEFYGERILPQYATLSFLLVLNTTDGSRLASTVYPEGTVPPTFPPFVTGIPSATPTTRLTVTPTVTFTTKPTIKPTTPPTALPTWRPTPKISSEPTKPTTRPSNKPSIKPTIEPTTRPTTRPTTKPSVKPTAEPTAKPTVKPTSVPTTKPTALPTRPTSRPTTQPTARPTTKPTTVRPTRPTTRPTASPTKVCLQWAQGDYGETCSATCNKLHRTCKHKYFTTIVTQETFYAVVEAAVGPAESFCFQTSASSAAVGGPAALSVVLSTVGGASVRTFCTYPTSAAMASADCDTALATDDFRRFCPCVDHDCDGAWYMGYSGESCHSTCDQAGGVCDAEPLSSITNADAFSAMVASATVLGTNRVIGETPGAYCDGGINRVSFATAPAVLTSYRGGANHTLCFYPTSRDVAQMDCDTSFTAIPAQRFCYCKRSAFDTITTHLRRRRGSNDE